MKKGRMTMIGVQFRHQFYEGKSNMADALSNEANLLNLSDLPSDEESSRLR